MRRTMVSLVSDQTQPNVLMIREFMVIRKTEFDRYIFVTTEKMENKGKTASIMEVCGIPGDIAVRVLVQEDSIASVIEGLAALKYDDDEESIVNITCGTKMMSIGAFQFFRDRRSEVYYLPLNANILKKIHPLVRESDAEIQYRLDLREYLVSHGTPIITFDKKNKTVGDFPMAGCMFRAFIGEKFNDAVMRRLRARRNDRNGVAIGDLPGLDGLLNNIGYRVPPGGVLSRDETRYITGGWFEEYVYWLVRDHGKIGDDYIGINLESKKGGEKNEFDVMFTFDNRLVMVECKTGLTDSRLKHENEQRFLQLVRQMQEEKEVDSEELEQLREIDLGAIYSNKNIVSETIYKSSALRRDFGLSVESYLFTLDRNLRGSDGEIKREHRDRAQNSQVHIVDRLVLGDDALMKETLRKMFGHCAP
ncbi:MAG TPA: DUF1887 family CARF protein [Spirochaetota bacterium]|nr:DUF1887 family CARF protein [Spirochaetota bacterium]